MRFSVVSYLRRLLLRRYLRLLHGSGAGMVPMIRQPDGTMVPAPGHGPPPPGHEAPPGMVPMVAEAPWSVAEWSVALIFDNPRATGLVLVLG